MLSFMFQQGNTELWFELAELQRGARCFHSEALHKQRSEQGIGLLIGELGAPLGSITTVCNNLGFDVHTLIKLVFIVMDIELVVVPHGGDHASTVLIVLCGFLSVPKGSVGN